MIVVVGLSHRTAPIGVRERLAIARGAVPALLDRVVKTGLVAEAALLCTCNRVELYAAPRAGALVDLEAAAGSATQVLASVGGDAVAAHLVARVGDEALRHLFRVAASLDSLVVGEPQILGQVKDAIALAHEARALGPSLARAMESAVRVGKRVRSETQIGAGQASVSTVAVDLARQIFGDLEGRKAMLLGAGEMAESAAKLVARAGAKLTIVNRSRARADELAAQLGAEARTLEALEATLAEVDVVITSTSSPTPLVTVELAKRVMKARRGRSLFLVDIAVPRDVDPAVHKLDNVFLYDVDDLSRLVFESMSGRAAEAEKAEGIVAAELAALASWEKTRSVKPAVVALRTRTRDVLGAELERSLEGRLRHLPEADRDALRAMLDAATNKLMHGPTTQLRTIAASSRADEVLAALREVFELPDAPDATASREATDSREPRDSANARDDLETSGERQRPGDGTPPLPEGRGGVHP